ncbi:MAG: hypothetical protein QOF48_3052 [Verrucomicrobiota bacterium]
MISILPPNSAYEGCPRSSCAPAGARACSGFDPVGASAGGRTSHRLHSFVPSGHGGIDLSREDTGTGSIGLAFGTRPHETVVPPFAGSGACRPPAQRAA